MDQLDRHGLALDAARAWLGLGRTLLAAGRPDDAAAPLEQAAQRFEQLDQAGGRGGVHLLRAELAMTRHEPDLARRELDRALTLLVNRPAEAAVARQHLAALALQAGAHEDAECMLDEALQSARAIGLAPLMADLLHLRASLRARQGRGAEALAELRDAVEQIERVRGTLQADRLRGCLRRGPRGRL